MSLIKCFLTLLLMSIAVSAPGDSVLSMERKMTQLADGVYTIRHVDPFDTFVDGNTTVIIGDRDVFVVDSCSLPSSAREDIDQIRKWTDKPVRYLLNTHWHTDHNAGNQAYRDAFPSVEIIATKETNQIMRDRHPHLLNQHDASKLRLKWARRQETGKDEDGKPLTKTQKAEAAAKIAKVDRMLAEYEKFVFLGPTLTYDRELDIDLGNREVQVKFLGRGNTGGDSIALLAKENILITGDLVVHPVPYTFDGYPAEWSHTLEKMAHLDVNIIVPGHGEVLHDKTYIYFLIDLFETVVRDVNEQLSKDAYAKLEDVQKAIDLTPFLKKVDSQEKFAAGFFKYATAKLIELAYYEAKQE